MCRHEIVGIRTELGKNAEDHCCMCRHEIVGIITEVGSNAEGHFKLGDKAGVGCLVRSCKECDLCNGHDENYCSRLVFTYNGKDWGENEVMTQGGYSNRIVLDHRSVLHSSLLLHLMVPELEVLRSL